MPELLARLASLALLVTFTWAVAAKAMAPRSWGAAVGGYRLGPLAPVVFFGVPLAELAVATTFALSLSLVASAATLVLISAFSLALLRARALQGDRLPCGCFGKGRVRDYRVMLARNAVLGALAGLVLLHGANVSPLPPQVGSDDAVPAAITGFAVGIAIWVCTQTMGQLRGRSR